MKNDYYAASDAEVRQNIANQREELNRIWFLAPSE